MAKSMGVSQLEDSYLSANVYDKLHSQFGWQVPEDFNIADVCCARWAK